MLNLIVLAIVCGLTIVNASPVMPERELGEIDPVDACLFLCNICYNNDTELMMNCANKICLSEHFVTEYSLYVMKQLCPIKEKPMFHKRAAKQ